MSSLEHTKNQQVCKKGKGLVHQSRSARDNQNKSLTSDSQIWVASQYIWAQSQRRLLNWLHWLHIWSRRKGPWVGLSLKKSPPSVSPWQRYICCGRMELSCWRHSDVIWCDSLWSISQDIDNLQAIVIMDKHSKNQLTAMCLVVKESTLSWFHFFSWVQHQISSFKPQCVVTDGAAGIYNAFKQATSTTPFHIVCWWHKAHNKDKNWTE